MITTIARKAGFGGGIVVDYPNSRKARKVFLCLMVGSGRYPGANTEESSSMDVDNEGLPRGLNGEDPNEEKRNVTFERRRARERLHGKKKKKGGIDKEWILKKKELYRQRGKQDVPNDSKYTGRRRKPVF